MLFEFKITVYTYCAPSRLLLVSFLSIFHSFSSIKYLETDPPRGFNSFNWRYNVTDLVIIDWPTTYDGLKLGVCSFIFRHSDSSIVQAGNSVLQDVRFGKME